MIGWILLALAGSAQQSQDPCAEAAACRLVGSMRVENAAGESTAVAVNQKLPWVVQDNLLLVPGDWIIVQLVDRDGALVPMLVSAGSSGEAPQPQNGEIRFKVHSFDKGGLIMEGLSRRPEALDYAALVVVGKDNPQRSSVCSLLPGKTVFESWQWPIRQIALWSFRPTTEIGCKTLDLTVPSKKG